MKLTDQVIVVTGGANGIGRALCERFANERAQAVIVSDIDLPQAEAVAKKIGGDAIHCDVSQESDIRSLVDWTLQKYGRIDLFVSNAGVTSSGGIEIPDAEWQRQWNVNVMAHVYAARAVLPHMLTRGCGYLLQTASAAGLLTEIGSAPYSATKHAAVAFAEWLSVNYQRRGIKVSCLCPAGVATDFLDLNDPVHQFLHLSSVTPEQVADCVVDGIEKESFLILPHPQVREFFQFKTVNYESWLRNFSRVHEKIERSRVKEARKRTETETEA